jgi:hypothetical protein
LMLKASITRVLGFNNVLGMTMRVSLRWKDVIIRLLFNLFTYTGTSV